jgi:hypothetical protein
LAKINKVAALRCNSEVCGRTFDPILPSVVRRLYFETRLVNAFEKHPLERLRGLDWDLVIAEAERNLLDFQHWEANSEISGESS